MSDGKKILICEDEKPLSSALSLKLKSAGYESKVAGNGREGLEILAKEKFDLVLLDLIMPEVDGFGVLEEMKKQGNPTPVIVLSNLGQEEDVKKAKDSGAKDFFIKADTPLSSVIEKIKANIG